MRDEEAYYDEEEEKSYKKPNWTTTFHNFFSRDDYDYEDQEENEEAFPQKNIVTIWNDVKSLSQAKNIIDNLREGQTQIVTFENCPEDVAQDVRNFLYGAVYSLDANIGNITEKNIIITPRGLSIENSGKYKLGLNRRSGTNF